MMSRFHFQNFMENKNHPLVALIDTGTKYSIIRNLIKNWFLSVIRCHGILQLRKYCHFNPQGIVISNGPGDPIICSETIETASKIIENSIPTLGICLGHQILSFSRRGKNT